MSEEKPIYKKRTIHAVKELNFDVLFYKDIDEAFYAIIRSFYNGAEQEWRSSSFETYKECHEWARDKVRKAGWQIQYMK